MYSNPGTQVGTPEQGFRHCFTDGLNQSLVCLWRRLDLGTFIKHKVYIFPQIVNL